MSQPPLDRAAPVDDAGFTWAGLRFLLIQGQLALGAPVAGKVSTAVFVGHGALQVLPPDTQEGQQMQRFLGRPQIAVAFTQAVFRFADARTFESVLGSRVQYVPLSSEGDAGHVLRDRVEADAKSGSPVIARLLQALDAPQPSHLFMAELKIRDGAWLDAQFDPSQPDSLRVFAWVPVLGTGLDYPDIWTQFTPSGMAQPTPPPRFGDYHISAHFGTPNEFDATAEFNVSAPQAAGRGLLLGLNPSLRVTGVTADGIALAWVQPPEAGWFYLRLPASSAVAAVNLTVNYRGRTPLQPGSENQGGTALVGWYPTLPLDPPWAVPAPSTTFDLHFSLPDKYLLLASGQRVADSVSGGTEISEWKSPTALRAAGFTIGELTAASRQLILADGRSLQLTLAAPKSRDPAALLPLAGTKLGDIFDFMGANFGPYPYPAAALTTTGLEPFLPLTDPQAMLVAFDPRSFVETSPDMTELSPAVSAAGQWWGAWTAPASPRDEWLTQGLRSASGLFYQWDRYGPAAALETLRQWRQFLLSPGPESRHIPEFTGPLSLGAARLGSHADSGVSLLQVKGGYIIYMLRQMMQDPRRPGPGTPFLAMMRDFTATYGGREVSSAEFQAMVEKHMTPAMDLDHNHKMDWFFRPLLDGTAVPELHFHADTAPAVKGVAQVTLTVENPQHWKGLLPVYLFHDANTWVSGLIPITQDHVTATIPTPFAPRYVEADHFLDMLISVRQ